MQRVITYERQIAEVNTVLAHEHGFEAVYQQYLYICENTGNRYFLNTNGWAGLFSAQTLDFPLFQEQQSGEIHRTKTAQDGQKQIRGQQGDVLCAAPETGDTLNRIRRPANQS